MERLQKIIAESGYTSRRKAEELIKNGKVIVNGKVVTELGSKANYNDDILVEGKKIEKEEKEYYIFNKPRGVITSTSDDKGRKVVTDYFDSNKRLFPVGRLDYDTTGLLIVTNDGKFANLIMHPSNEIEKVYIAKINKIIKSIFFVITSQPYYNIITKNKVFCTFYKKIYFHLTKKEKYISPLVLIFHSTMNIISTLTWLISARTIYRSWILPTW